MDTRNLALRTKATTISTDAQILVTKMISRQHSSLTLETNHKNALANLEDFADSEEKHSLSTTIFLFRFSSNFLQLLMILQMVLHPSHRVKQFKEMALLQVNQLNQLRAIFARFDMDSDGSLTLLELAALLRSLGLKPSGDQIHVLLANMDSNGNGAVEFDELVNAIMPDMTEEILINQGKLLEVFRSFDRDGNGYITLAELAGSMAKMGQPLTYRELTEMVQEADTNGDGVISFNEFASVMAKSAADFLGLGDGLLTFS